METRRVAPRLADADGIRGDPPDRGDHRGFPTSARRREDPQTRQRARRV